MIMQNIEDLLNIPFKKKAIIKAILAIPDEIDISDICLVNPNCYESVTLEINLGKKTEDNWDVYVKYEDMLREMNISVDH